MTTDTDDTSNIRIYGIVVVFGLEACRGFNVRAAVFVSEYEAATRKTINIHGWEGLWRKVGVASSHNQVPGLGSSRERFLLGPRCHLTACELDRF